MILQSWHGVHSRFLTPFKIGVLAVVASYCRDLIPSEHRIRVMNAIMHFIDTGSDRVNDHQFDLAALHSVLRDVPATINCPLWDVLVMELWALGSVDQFHRWFLRLNLIMAKPLNNDSTVALPNDSVVTKLSSTSILGAFVRKCYLALEKLEFSELVELWDSFCLFREPSAAHYSEIDPEGASNLAVSAGGSPSGLASILAAHLNAQPTIDPLTMSDDTLESLFQTSIKKLQADNSALLPDSVNVALKQLVGSNRSVPPSAYFLQYLEACQSRDHERAFEYLHRFFDYSTQSDGRSYYHYALFTVAVLHAEFNGVNEALRAAQEAIAVARENMDYACLTEILSWLYAYFQNNPECPIPDSLVSKDQMAVFLRSKASETSSVLATRALEADAVTTLSQGMSLGFALESALKGSYLSMINNAPHLAADINMVRSVLWTRAGVDVLAGLYQELATDKSARPHQTALLSCHQLLARGQIDRASRLLEKLKPNDHTSVAYHQKWLPNYLLVEARKAIYKDQLPHARNLLDRLQALFVVEAEIMLQARCADIELDIATGEISGAITKAHEQMEQCTQTDADVVYHIKLTLLLVRAHCESAHPTRALSLVLKCFQMALRVSLLPLALEALVLLSIILTSRGEYQDSLAILDRSMPRISETRNIYLIAEAYEAMADATAGLITQYTGTERVAFVERAFRYTVDAAKSYEKLDYLKRLLRVCEKQRILSVEMGDSQRAEKIESIVTELSQRLANTNWSALD